VILLLDCQCPFRYVVSAYNLLIFTSIFFLGLWPFLVSDVDCSSCLEGMQMESMDMH
jgi:hypothetical protein